MGNKKIEKADIEINLKLEKEIHLSLRKWKHAEIDNLSILENPALPQLEESLLDLEKNNKFFADLLSRRFWDNDSILFLARQFNLS